MSKSIDLSQAQIDYILSPKAIRERAETIFQKTLNDETAFQFHPEKLKPTVDYVMKVIRENYPDLKIPFHSRWGHFRVGGIDRVKSLDQTFSKLDPLEKARCKLDLVIPSVLLDAGAGATWKFEEKTSGKMFSRSEGLGVASLEMFLSGKMSDDGKSLRSDSRGLQKIKATDVALAFQVSEKNPLIGVEGRASLLNNLGRALENKNIFKDGRPGNIIDYLMASHGTQIPATSLLRAVLDGLGSIWPGRLSAGSTNLGDVWRYSKISDSYHQLVPFHKLSQWMTYSLIEPMEEAGLKVEGVAGLTGLAEYRNGGLLLDSGLVTLRNPKDADQAWTPDTDLIIEWRALTVHLLDQIGSEVQKNLKKSSDEFPLAKVLEGGTWWAGRRLAQNARPASGDPPLKIQSDGTVF